jgi:type II secretory pathway component PulC
MLALMLGVTACERSAPPERSAAAPAADPVLATAAPLAPLPVLPASILQDDPGHYRIDYEVVTQLLLYGAAGDFTVERQGPGWKLGQVAPGSLLARLGLLDGDVVLRLGGVDLVDRRSLVAAYQVAQRGRALLELQRAGAPFALDYAIFEHLTTAQIDDSTQLNDLDRALALGVKAVDPTHYEVRRFVADRIFGDPTAVLGSGARVVPATRDGKPYGVKVYAVRPGSIWAYLDIENGDIIVAIDEHSIVDVQAIADLAPELKRAETLQVDLVRRGVPRHHSYHVWQPKPGVDPMPEAPATAPPLPDDFAKALAEGIRVVDALHYDVRRPLIELVLANPTHLGRARIVPSVKDGKADGFKLYAIRSDEFWGRLGFENGDVLHAVNDLAITTPDSALEVYSKLREADSLRVDLTRRGVHRTHVYRILR